MIHAVPSSSPDPSIITQAVKALVGGKLIILPTETVYGIACDPRVNGAEEAVYAAKGRPQGKPIARFVLSPEDFFQENQPRNRLVLALAEKFMPGPLTLVLPFYGDWVGFRIPDHPVPLAILDALGAPLAVTSANRSGGPDPKTAEAAVEELGNTVEITLDAGPCEMGVASTVIKVEDNKIYMLREGALPTEELAEFARQQNGLLIHEE